MKLYETVLEARISSSIYTENLISPYQAGSRANYSTIDHIFAFSHLLQSSIQKTQLQKLPSLWSTN